MRLRTALDVPFRRASAYTPMTQDTAGRMANVVLAAAAVAAAVYVLRDPARRRTAVRILGEAVRAAGPWLIAETRRAWAESGSAALRPQGPRV